MDKIKIYRQDGTFYETDNYKVISISSKDIGDLVECDNGVKVIHNNGKEFLIDNAIIKDSMPHGLSYRSIEMRME